MYSAMSLKKHTLFSLLFIFLVGLTMFGRVSTAYFCGYDDFLAMYRAAFEDHQNPAAIFTETHWGTSKYRPLDRASDEILWQIGHGSALPFRIRNLLFHFVGVVCVYAIVLLWTGEWTVSLIASMLFCLAPVANQPVVAASFPTTTAFAFLLSAFLFFLYWLHFGRGWFLFASTGCALIGLFFYEPVIAVFGMMLGYFVVWRRSGHQLRLSQFMAWSASSVTALLIFGWARHMVVSAKADRVPLAGIIRNASMYALALVSPIDAISANQLLVLPCRLKYILRRRQCSYSLLAPLQ